MGKINVVEFNEDASVVASGESASLHLCHRYALSPQHRFVRLNSQALGPSVRHSLVFEMS